MRLPRPFGARNDTGYATPCVNKVNSNLCGVITKKAAPSIPGTVLEEPMQETGRRKNETQKILPESLALEREQDRNNPG